MNERAASYPWFMENMDSVNNEAEATEIEDFLSDAPPGTEVAPTQAPARRGMVAQVEEDLRSVSPASCMIAGVAVGYALGRVGLAKTAIGAGLAYFFLLRKKA